MKLLTVDYPEQGVCQLTLTATAEELEAGAAIVYERTREGYTIKGFEKGAANREEIEADRGEHVFWYDAINDIMDRDVPALYDAVVEEQNLYVVSEPIYDLVSVKKDEGFTATVSVCLKPDVTVGDYKGISAKCEPTIVHDSDVEHFIERKRQQAAELVPHKGPAVKGNIVHLTYIGFVDGAAFDGGRAENQKMELGKGQMIPGFEEAIIGHEAGDAFDIEVTFPANYGKKELAGKPAVFKAKLEDACLRQIPALNADFAKKVGKVDTMEEYRAAVRAQLEGLRKQNAMSRAKTLVLGKLAAVTEGAVAEPLIGQAYAGELQQIQQMLQMQHINMGQFLQQIQKTKEEFTEEVRKSSREKVLVSFALLKIAEMEGVVPTEEEIDAEIATRAERAKKPVEEYAQNVNRRALIENLSRTRAVDIVIAHANIEE